jgi:hypothetical protein
LFEAIIRKSSFLIALLKKKYLMNKTLLHLLFVTFVFINFSITAQEKHELKCKMTVEEILRSQPFDIDHPTSENARYITIILNKEFAIIYEQLNEGNSQGLEEHIIAIESAIISAKEINMNYSMFTKDIEFLEELK